MSHGHETHAMPPQAICDVYKKYVRLKAVEVKDDLDVVDFQRGITEGQAKTLKATGKVDAGKIAAACGTFEELYRGKYYVPAWEEESDCKMYEDTRFPGTW